MVRIPPAPLEGPDADPDSIERIRQLRDGQVSTLYRTLLHSGDIAAGWCSLGTAVRWSSTLDDRLRELLTCQVARLTEASYEWQSHRPLALAAGVSEAQLASLPHWRDEPSFEERDRAALMFADRVVEGQVDDEAFTAVSRWFQRREVVEIAATSAYYLSISRFLQACGVEGTE